MNKTQQDETQALMYAGLPEMPAEADATTPVWINAIAKCLSHNLRETYAIVKMNYGKSPIIVRSFNTDGIAKVVSVHPYKFLDAKFVPKFSRAADTNQYIANVYGVSVSSVSKLKKEERLRLFYTHCIKQQEAYEKEQSQKTED